VARIIGDLLKAEIAEKQARPVRARIAAAHLPLARELGQFDFTGTPVNAALVQERASGGTLAQQCRAVLVGGTGTGKRAIWPWRSHAAASAAARGRGSPPPLIWSTGWKRRRARGGRGASPIS
jgi:DNA replication protein DnaC